MSNVIEKVLIGLAIMAFILLCVVVSQPAWRGDEMTAEFKSDCAKRRGILLEHKNMFGTRYECASSLGGQQ